MKEHNFGGDEIARHHDLVDITGPFRDGLVTEIAVEIDILPLSSQAGGRVQPGFGVGAPPVIKEQVVQRIGCDQMAYLTKRVHIGPKVIAEFYR